MSDKGDEKTPSAPKLPTPPEEEEDVDPSLISLYGNTSVSAPPLNLVVVHPLVLLSVVDHYTRVAKDTSKRVVGVLLGEVHKGKVDITNSYAVPFEEDPKDSTAWYIDRQYHEDMYGMFKKVNASEKIVGWYSTGPKIRPVDIEIHELFRSYSAHPVLVIIDVNPKTDPLEIPTQAYIAVESSQEEKKRSRRQFAHLPATIGAYEAEEVGVEHLLRNIRDSTDSSLADQVNAKLQSLKALHNRLADIVSYLDSVINGTLPLNHNIINSIQDMFNLTPDLAAPELVKAMTLTSNDSSMLLYVSSLIRAILALHDLINNKQNNQRIEREEKEKGTEKDKDKDKEKEKEKEKAKEKGEGEKKEKEDNSNKNSKPKPRGKEEKEEEKR